MTNRLEPELIEKIEEIVSRRLKEVLEERAKLVTVDRFAEAMDRIDKRFNAMQKQLDQRFEAMQKQLDQRFNAGQKQMNGMSIILENIQSQLGKPFEQFARNMVSRILEGEGITKVQLKKIHLRDKDRMVFTLNEDIEIDGLSEKPPIIIEVTAILRDQEKVETFLRKKKFIEKYYNKKFRGFFVASGSELPRDQLADVSILLRKDNCELINL